MSSNTNYLRGVARRLAPAILEFCGARVGQEFHADDLRRSVPHGAPGSADRVLRHLRQQGSVSYRVVNRAQSLYIVNWVAGR